jgi:RNA polymerase sigma-70 factor, ECF subfamily
MELLKRFRQGDPEAFEALFRQFQAEVYGWIVRIVRDPSVAEDLTVETFWRIHRARGRFDPSASFGAWARRIATNLAIDHLRRTRPEVALPDDLAQPATGDPIVCRETRRQIAVAFRRLPLKLRVAATLSLIEERSPKEIAEALDISEGVVRVRVFRAVRLLRQQLRRVGMTR